MRIVTDPGACWHRSCDCPHSMRILLTGGTGVVGPGTVSEPVARGHTIRLLSRHAVQESRQWPIGVEALDGSVTKPDSIRSAADGCAAVIHMAAVVTEPADATFERVNVEGTRHVVREAERAGAVRLLYISSLGADRGASAYHKSKLEGERIALASSLDTTVLRLANVYGPGDEIISLLIKMIRILPVVPAIDGGDDAFQPMWVGDAAKAIAACVERGDLGGRALDFAGPDLTSMNDLIGRVRDITGRTPLTVPVTGGMTVAGAKLASMIGVDVPIDQGQITMLEEGNLIRHPGDNALTSELGVAPTPLTDGLKLLADSLPEQLPDDKGVGSLRRKQVWVDIRGSRLGAEQLLERFRQRFSELSPWSMNVGSEPGTRPEPSEGETLTMAIPLRGNVQVRVEELTPRSMTLATPEGHPLVGAVRFMSEERGDCIRFEVQVYDRAADVTDWLIMHTVGQMIQKGTWKSIVRNVAKESGGDIVGGVHAGVHTEVELLDEEQAGQISAWLRDLVVERKREEAVVGGGAG